jgi:hypothetical protein
VNRAALFAFLGALSLAPHPALSALVAADQAGTRSNAAARTLVVCAPGYPGTTAEAQSTMDSFAAAAAGAAGWKPGALAAVYHETLKGGVERLGAPDAALALVTLPFYLEERARLRLAPRLQVSIDPAGAETWSLAAKKGLVASAAALDGWEILGNVGYSPAFVRGTILGDWGTVPASARIAFAPAVLSALRRAASGEKTAVILDAAGAAALPTLPFASDLEVVARSAALPSSLLCTVGDRLPARDALRLIEGLKRLHRTPAGAAILKSMRMVRFEPVDEASLRSARQAFERAGS